MVFLIFLCVVQLGSLARISIISSSPPPEDADEAHAAGNGDLGAADAKAHQYCPRFCAMCTACTELVGDLRFYAGSTVVGELVVLILFAAGSFAGDASPASLTHLEREGFVSPSIRFILSQAALCLVLVRLYTAWL